MKLTVLNVAYPFAPVGPNAVGGAEQVLTALDAAIVAAGHRSIVVACHQSESRGTLVPSVACHETLSGDLCAFLRSEHRRQIEEALARWPIDVIHMHGVDFYEYLPDTERPILVTLHLPLSYYPAHVLRELPPNVRFHCVSESQQQTCDANLNFISTIENGVDVDRLSACHAKRNFAVALGRICPEKGLHHAVDAARRADIPLFIGGEAFGYESHQRYLKHEFLPRLDRWRRWIGPVGFNRKRRLLTAARCLLVPSLAAETSSLVVMEALACGTPVIAFPNGALADIVEHGKTGFLVRDVDEMCEAIRSAHEIDPAVCRATARERFSLEQMTRAYLGAYEQLARGCHRLVEECCVA
ncbi:MAG TPA: glycosyltransferase family 4 protein [Verrucomicrobiae bacterium]|jgi:glycosyltransferase involved in cell wall biosynthesis